MFAQLWQYLRSCFILYAFIADAISTNNLETVSGIGTWVDVATPMEKHSYVSSRGQFWELLMSDEFNDNISGEKRRFDAGYDHLWTSLEKPDGVNGALEVYSHNMTQVNCENDVCFLEIKVIEDVQNVTIFNQYLHPPSFTNITFFYRSAMLQTWNKFCFQGGMLEVKAQLPASMNEKSRNPDLARGPTAPVKELEFYPAWPGIWMMGNLGRAIFSASTQRMWPFSYNDCNEKVFNSSNQRISACDPNPGFGLHPNQGRGAPEIDLIEGGGSIVSSSIQVAPGMPKHYRRIEPDPKLEVGGDTSCKYSATCVTPGANQPNIPSQIYAQRKHKSWYEGLRYSSNNFCARDQKLKQDLRSILKSLSHSITENNCSVTTCPASNDIQSDLGFIDGDVHRGHWGINSQGTCFSAINAYDGTHLCDPDNQDANCLNPRLPTTAPTNSMPSFNYQMDALSANWPIHVGGYTSFMTYQVEWVMGPNGYVRWMLENLPLFEIPASSVLNVPQDSDQSNPKKIMPEEPMYLILNVAVSGSWGATPPNVGRPCRGNGSDEKVNRICDGFPMYLKIDYIRLYQDLSNQSTMAVGCDPPTHPTHEWIESHIEEYEDYDNKLVQVQGGASCRDTNDCTAKLQNSHPVRTGTCTRRRCVCTSKYWGGPRCTTATYPAMNSSTLTQTFGPSLPIAVMVAMITLVATFLALLNSLFEKHKKCKK